MEGFRFVYPQEVTFCDLDVFGHVDNAVDLTYLEHEIRGPGGRLVAAAATPLVAFDYHGDATMPVPDLWRERIEAYEATEFAAV